MTETYAAVHSPDVYKDGRCYRFRTGTIMHKSTAKRIRQLVKQNGGNEAGWFIVLTFKPIGTTIKVV